MSKPSLALGPRIKTCAGADVTRRAGKDRRLEATLSRVENSRRVSAHHLYRLALALGVDITAFFEPGSKSISNGIRSICRKGEGIPLTTARYDAQVLCTDIANKRMHPAIDTVTVRSLEAAGGYSRHDGEEFLHVLAGHLLLATEFYEPVILDPGDSIYFDSHMGHAYLSADGRPYKSCHRHDGAAQMSPGQSHSLDR
jgi:transcriptional regulator with XRE-family HTH domain